MRFDTKARRKQQIEAWNRVFGKDIEYVEGCEETLGEAIVIFIEKMSKKSMDISPTSIRSITWHTGDPDNPKSVRKRYITADQAKKAHSVIALMSLSPIMASVASLEEAVNACYDIGVEMQVCDTAESLLTGEDIFFSDKEREEIIKRAGIMRKDLMKKRNRIMNVTLRNIHLSQELLEEQRKEKEDCKKEESEN